LTVEATTILTRGDTEACGIIKAQIGKRITHVFTYEGEPVTRANNHAWRKGLKRAGIVDFRWHDLRHTWASWHIQNGTPVHVLKALGGWLICRWYYDTPICLVSIFKVMRKMRKL
jgi:hypothetical protein